MNQQFETEMGTVLAPYAGPVRSGAFRMGRLSVSHAGFSLRGSKRDANDDRLYVAEKFGLIAIADGIGGSVGGGQSAQDCVDMIEEYLSAREMVVDPVATLREAVNWTNGRMLAQAWRPGGSERNPGGCCLAGVLLDERKAEYTVFHVGDSSVHAQTGRTWRKLTTDHLERPARLVTVPRTLRKPRIRRAMGLTPAPDVDFATFPIRSRERLMITSDGCDLEYLADLGVVAPAPDPDLSLDDSIRDLATVVSAGPLRDDSSAIMIEIASAHDLRDTPRRRWND